VAPHLNRSRVPLVRAVRDRPVEAAQTAPHTAVAPPIYKHVSKVAFGSCTAYDLRPQPIWTEVGYASHPIPPCIHRTLACPLTLDRNLCSPNRTSCPPPVQGVIPAKPDAWVWLGDLAYVDNPVMPCKEAPSSPECNCTADFMHQPQLTCKAGDPDHAQRRFSHQVLPVDRLTG
jgi:alkaline phosphatase D